MKDDKRLLCLLVAVFTVIKVDGAGGGGSHHEFTNNNFAFHEPQNKFLRFNAAQKSRLYKMSKTLC